MSESMQVDPDLKFIDDMARLGGEEFKRCFQCAACSGTCPISPDKDPFPRKEMIWAVWGLKDKLVKDADIWLCHQCNDCSILCPRGGNPGDILAAARNYAYQHYAVPGFLGRALACPKALLPLLAVPVVILLVALGVKTGFALTLDTGQPWTPEHEFKFAYFFPTTFLLDPIFVATAVVAVGLFIVGLKRFWSAISQGTQPVRGFGSAVALAVGEILSHSRFNQCDQAKGRYLSHLLTFYGFLALLVTTTCVAVGYYLREFDLGPAFAQIELPMRLYHPVKILGNAGAISFLVGLILLLRARATDEAKAGRSNYQDWLFLGVMLGLAVTGILTELLRLSELIHVACVVYFVHLVLVWFLIGYLPFSKFAHLAYRFVAIIHAKYVGRYEMASEPARATASAAAKAAS